MAGRSIFSGKGSFMGMMKQHPEVVPVIAAVGIGCCGAAYYIGRLATRPDVVWSGRGEMPWTRVSQNTNLHFSGFSNFKTPTSQDPEDLRGKL
mmetsp:Transcript_34388/g.90152  ORF Transcript_34388/g.90152 Transcript_34388/m.90152 type:complete len:93 (-) Transcript_34388:143-421(-)|eukprot:CAMPEP_0206285378 /NCGR_PEP_ID=MMETSP0106_2-20121207/68_1 /ASSEMBLY_ACC=CAM_ASM_000206 /TAXON_ID=81532 /ORGANISM="Acanthoeca-like sp., Strain 10tr" /LENGTH=92 /DNA_ID=CAMNT_0053715895 /DNA_START=18 /DNA_END=296 /DNA_ORIENTATION=-